VGKWKPVNKCTIEGDTDSFQVPKGTDLWIFFKTRLKIKIAIWFIHCTPGGSFDFYYNNVNST